MKIPLIRPLFDGEELEVSIQGLEIMNDDPGEVDVLYAKVEEQSGRLQVGFQAKACFFCGRPTFYLIHVLYWLFPILCSCTSPKQPSHESH